MKQGQPSGRKGELVGQLLPGGDQGDFPPLELIGEVPADVPEQVIGLPGRTHADTVGWIDRHQPGAAAVLAGLALKNILFHHRDRI